MRALSDREKRTIRRAAIALGLYLVLFYGWKGVRFLEEKRGEHQALVLAAEDLKLEVLRERVKAMKLARLKEASRIDLAKLRRESLVGESIEALQKAAQACGLALGPSRETPGRAASKELSLIQLEGVGPTAAALLFLHGLESLGVPLLVDSLHVRTSGMGPGQVQVSLTVAVLDPASWQAASGAEKEKTGV